MKILTRTYAVDMVMQVLDGSVIGNWDPFGKEGVHNRAAADVAKAGIGRREIDQGLNSLGYFFEVACVAVGSVDKLHGDEADGAGGELPCESVEDARYEQATDRNVVKSLCRPVLSQSLVDSDVWTVLDPADGGLGIFVQQLGSGDSEADLQATSDDGIFRWQVFGKKKPAV